ncbi:MAG: ATP-binding protein [Clostridiales bacterium]|nr:ATP-binding protein [Clostridiales bacterium]
MKKKIFIYYFLIIIIGITVTGVFISQFVFNIYKDKMFDKLIGTAGFLKYELKEDILQGKVNSSDFYNIWSKKYSTIADEAGQRVRITIVKDDGTVLGESDADYQEMGGHLDRKEIAEAFKGLTGIDIRKSSTLGMEFMYVALHIEEQNLVLRISTPLTELNRIYSMIWLYVAFACLVGLMIALILSLKTADIVTKPLKTIVSAFSDIAAGNFQNFRNFGSPTVMSTRSDEISRLAHLLNDIAHRLNDDMLQLIDKNARIEQILDSIINGIIVVDSEMKIVHINKVALGIFSKNPVSLTGRHISEYVRNSRINTMMQESVKDGTSRNFEFEYSDERIFKVSISPLCYTAENAENEEKIHKENMLRGCRKLTGIILLLQDITNIRKLEKIRSEFVANVTHELKTPITSIRGFVELLKNDYSANSNAEDEKTFKSCRSCENIRTSENDETSMPGGISKISEKSRNGEAGENREVGENSHNGLTDVAGSSKEQEIHNGYYNNNLVEKFLYIIDVEAERLNNLINDILLLSEIENTSSDANISNHNLRGIVNEVVSVLQNIAVEKRVVLRNLVDEKINISANKDRIKQMLINLVENGIKYNKIDGEVIIKARRSEGILIINIADTGIGIPSEYQERIFERFYRVDKGRSRNQGGTGLGLSIVKHIVNLYSGDINVSSEPGRGTEFTIQLPV